MKKKFNLSINDKIKPFNIKLNEVDRDKSISIRAFIIAAISEGISEINHPLQSEDVFSCINSLKKLNVKIKKLDQNKFQVFGKSLGSLFAKKNTVLDFGNSGTAMRLITGLLATIPGLELKLQGDHSLSKRNMKKIFNLCELFGAEFLPANKFTLPIKMITSSIPVAIQYDPGVSAQLKSAAMLAGTNAYGISTIYDQNFSRNHTENILDKVKAIKILKQNKHNTIKVFGKKTFRAQKFEVPVDPSSAAFFVVLTILAQNSKLSINHVCLNERRIGYLKILKKAGAKIKLTKLKKVNNETIGTIDVSSSKLKPLKVNKKFYSMTADEYPILFVAAALTKGLSIFDGIEDLTNKESNRVSEMQKVLNQIGIKSRYKNGKLKIFGKNNIRQQKKNILVKDLGDHRICMSASILALLTGNKVNIKNFSTVNTSAPSFLKNIKKMGGRYDIK